MDTVINTLHLENNIQTSLGDAPRRPYIIPWALCCVVVAVIFLTYVATSLMLGKGEVVLPLDDTYIHFQYAGQLAEGQPYVYNPGDPPTSGATSFLYPYVLAIGYGIGFQGLWLGLWAMSVGAVALLASTWVIFLSGTFFGLNRWVALFFALLFALNGVFAWHFMSGMETGLIVTFALLVLYMLVTERTRGFAIAASLLALTRPEGSIMAVIAVGILTIWQWIDGNRAIRPSPGYIIPILAVFVQPIVNLLFTGSPSSTGGQAKSILSTVPFYLDEVIGRVLENFTRMWWEFLNGTNGTLMPFLLPILAIIGWGWLMLSRERRYVGIIVLGWFLAVSGAIATLDTAFWHFKRYQMPLMALIFPLAAWGVVAIMGVFRRQWVIEADIRHVRAKRASPLQIAVFVLSVIFLLLPTLATGAEFLRLFRVNVANVMAQPLPMARWLQENTPEDTVIAVHDVGMMRYIGERYTIDMVGLTTPGAADAWRNGPGAVAEFLDHHDPLPDYVAAYTTARGLNYLADTDIYGDLLAGFTAQYDPADNVALGAEFQGIFTYRREETTTFESDNPQIDDFVLMDTLNVADVTQEQAHDYAWRDDVQFTGFSTEVYAFGVRDGGRRINGEERFTMRAEPGQDGILITRVHPVNRGTFDVYVGDTLVDTQWIPAIPGQWMEIGTLIPAEYITDNTLNLRIVPDVPGGHYMPYYHWWLQGEYTRLDVESFEVDDDDIETITYAPIADFHEGVFTLFLRTEMNTVLGQLTVDMIAETHTYPEGDYKAFVHVYDDVDSAPSAQTDGYLGGLPGNWLPGITTERFTLDIGALPPGIYRVAVGFYNPYTFERLTPQSAGQLTGEIRTESITIDAANRRVFIGEIEVTGDE